MMETSTKYHRYAARITKGLRVVGVGGGGVVVYVLAELWMFFYPV